MTRYLNVERVKAIHRRTIDASGGSHGTRDENALDSAVAQPQQTFFGDDLYPELPEKAAALAFSLIQNHPFIDGNKRVGYQSMEAFLLLNGHEMEVGVDEAEQVVLSVAAGEMSREEFTEWVRRHMAARAQP